MQLSITVHLKPEFQHHDHDKHVLQFMLLNRESDNVQS